MFIDSTSACDPPDDFIECRTAGLRGGHREAVIVLFGVDGEPPDLQAGQIWTLPIMVIEIKDGRLAATWSGGDVEVLRSNDNRTAIRVSPTDLNAYRGEITGNVVVRSSCN